jgi:hypothetical protein
MTVTPVDIREDCTYQCHGSSPYSPERLSTVLNSSTEPSGWVDRCSVQQGEGYVC